MTLVWFWYHNFSVKVFLVMTTCIDPKELRSSQGTWDTPTSDSSSLRGSGPNSIASSSENLGYVGSSCLCTMAIISELLASPDSKDSSGQLGHVGQLSHPPRALVPHPVAQLPLLVSEKLQAPSPQPPTWRHLTGHPSQWEVWDTCEGPGWCCRVFLGEPLTVWHTAGGSKSVPLSDHTSSFRCPWGLGSW